MTRKAHNATEFFLWFLMLLGAFVTLSFATSCKPVVSEAEAAPYVIPDAVLDSVLAIPQGYCGTGRGCQVPWLRANTTAVSGISTWSGTGTGSSAPLQIATGGAINFTGSSATGAQIRATGTNSMEFCLNGSCGTNFTSTLASFTSLNASGTLSVAAGQLISPSGNVTNQEGISSNGDLLLQVDGATEVEISSTAMFPYAASGSSLGTTSRPWVNLILGGQVYFGSVTNGVWLQSNTASDFRVIINNAEEVLVTPTATTPAVAGGNALGSSSLEWSDAYLSVGTSTQETRANGYVASQVTSVGNVGTGEDTLYSQTIAGNALTTTGRGLKLTATGNIANNANSKTLIFYWGACTFSTGINIPVSISSAWRLTAYIYRTGSSTQRVVATWEGTNGATGLWAWVMQSTNACTETETGSVDIRVTGQSSAASDNDTEIYTALVENI